MNPKLLTLYAVTDRSCLRHGETLLEAVIELLDAGVTCVQLREKHASDEEILRLANQLKPVCRRYGVPLILNDRPDLALRAGVDGVHVGLSDMSVQKARELLGKDYLIGASAHNVKEALEAQEAGADYIGCGAVFRTATKKDVTALSVEELRTICRNVQIPVAAIGGITTENAGLLKETGIAGVAVAHSLFAAEDRVQAAREFRGLQIGSVNHTMKTALTIAGSDSGGGAGIQADIKTMIANGVYASTAITALTAQNTTGVRAVQEVSPDFLEQELDSVFEDIFPDAVKIGMVSDAPLISVIAAKLSRYRPSNIVIDPVMIATSGSPLLKPEAQEALKRELLGLGDLITPNIPETQVLTGITINGREDMLAAARLLAETYHCAVLCKGGHLTDRADDLLLIRGEAIWIPGKHIDTVNTHGTGCTLSSAIAANLAKGYPLIDAVKRAKEFVTDALEDGLDLGKGSGPLNHGAALRGRFL